MIALRLVLRCGPSHPHRSPGQSTHQKLPLSIAMGWRPQTHFAGSLAFVIVVAFLAAEDVMGSVVASDPLPCPLGFKLLDSRLGFVEEVLQLVSALNQCSR